MCFRIFFFNITVWDLLAKEETSEAQTTCKKLKCFLPVDTLSWDRKVVPSSAQLPGIILPSHLLQGPLVLARWKLKDSCPTPSCTAQTCILSLDILEMWAVELQPRALLHRRPTTPQFCPTPLCQVVFDRNTCFCAVWVLCRMRNWSQAVQKS